MFRRVAALTVGLMLSVAAGAQAGTIDLTTAGASGTANGAIFQQTAPQPTGTGVIDSFVRIQANGTEQGYNTDFRPVQFDEHTDIFTRSLLLSDVPVVNINGTNYRQFMLDINQSIGGDNGLLSLDVLQVFLGNAGNLHDFPTFDGQATKVFDLAGGSDPTVFIKLDAGLNPGSGIGDMFAFIPDSVFTGGSFVYLFSKFGVNNASNDGFEEWSVLRGSVPVPLPLAATQGLLAMGGLGLVGLVRRTLRHVR